MSTRKAKSKGPKGAPVSGARTRSPETADTGAEGRPAGEVVLYQSDDGSIQFDVRLEQETVWLTQAQIAALLGTTQSNVSHHLKNIYEEQ